MIRRSGLGDLGVEERILWLSLTGYHASGTNHRTATGHDQTADRQVSERIEGCGHRWGHRHAAQNPR